MFLEQNSYNNPGKGWVEVITGSMFSGKTEELIRRINRVKIANQKVVIIKPAIDIRKSKHKIVSHDNKSIDSLRVDEAADIEELVENANVVCIDEAQFFGSDLVNVCDNLANKGKRVIVAGLDMDFRGEPFGPMPFLITKAEFVTKLHAICTNCGDLAQFSYRKVKEETKILLGEKNEYAPLCRPCYIKKNKSNK